MADPVQLQERQESYQTPVSYQDFVALNTAPLLNDARYPRSFVHVFADDETSNSSLTIDRALEGLSSNAALDCYFFRMHPLEASSFGIEALQRSRRGTSLLFFRGGKYVTSMLVRENMTAKRVEKWVVTNLDGV